MQITSAVHHELHTWGRLLTILESRPTHLREIVPFLASWFGTTDSSRTGMGGVR